MSLTKFAELIAQRVRKDRQWIYIGVAASSKKLLTVFHVDTENGGTLSEQCKRFRDRADIREVA